MKHVRGDLHVHSTWSSDGKNTIEEMARRCIERGYEYMAITDHSHYLREGRLEAQWREVEQLNEKLAPFRILRGIEANIRATARSTSPRSCSRSSTGSSRRCTRRSTRTRPSGSLARWSIRTCTASAIRPRGRSTSAAGRRRRRARDREGARDETFLELNSQPDRLDLRDVNARRAGEAGLKVPVDTDAHEIRALDWIEIGSRRRGARADEGPRAEHAHLEADREAEEALALCRASG